MDHYHVLLLYPEHIANYYAEAYLSEQILANSEQEAVAQARKDCAEGNEQGPNWADNFTVLLVVKNGEIL